jgi:hypothetical protein
VAVSFLVEEKADLLQIQYRNTSSYLAFQFVISCLICQRNVCVAWTANTNNLFFQFRTTYSVEYRVVHNYCNGSQPRCRFRHGTLSRPYAFSTLYPCSSHLKEGVS